MSKRISRDDMFCRMALLVAERSTCSRKHVGALITQDNRVISMGYAGSPSGMPHCDEIGCTIGPSGGCTNTVHAEANAIAFAAREGIRVKGATMYVTLAPCVDCAKLIINAGIKTLHYLERYRLGEGIELLDKAGVEVIYHGA